ncbi:unnamed protein product [Oppiella nova]|uniref:beta-mannosidase n=1 Tax=Oppiella nova TaxID=334625 RepID=A0A7R9LG20_9ACAR|nr:unnamed protein product [Oppiella nova]CAG2163303.1 unnamed protein product [Oppiella nova]
MIQNIAGYQMLPVSANILSKQVVNLVVEGIDTVSNITVNGVQILRTINQFVRYVFDAKHALKSGQNSIQIHIENPQHYVDVQKNWYNKTYHYGINPPRGYIRKMGASFGWDWGPSFKTQGIWKPIGIEAYDKAIIRDITVETTPDAHNGSQWTLNTNIFIESQIKHSFEANITISLDGKVLQSGQSYNLTTGADGTAKLALKLPVNNMSITPWFPNGVTNGTQKLYELGVKIGFNGSTEVSEKVVKIGFRTIQVIQTPVKPKGLTFYFQVNGVPFFAKGTNWIPANILQEDLTRDYLKHMMESARDANMNMMRVWGGGVYESDYLYELADEYGIMLWQDFMFACGSYPSDPDFLATVDIEVTQQTRRLQHHPSIAIWSGIYFKAPSTGGIERYQDLVYLSQVVQAMAMKSATEHHRRNREVSASGSGNTMGALYWQLNDIWQGTTWSSIEYGGKWKLLHSYARDFFAKQLVTPYEDKNETLKVALVRDDYEDRHEFDTTVQIYKWLSTTPIHQIVLKSVSESGFSAQTLWNHSIPVLLKESGCADRADCVVRVDVPFYGISNFLLLTEPRNSRIVKPNVKLVSVKLRPNVEVNGNPKHVFDITLSTEAVAPFVSLDFALNSGIRGNFLENGFFIFDSRKTITFVTESNATETDIAKHLTIKTVSDVA